MGGGLSHQRIRHSPHLRSTRQSACALAIDVEQSPFAFARAERWPSGRRHQIANLAYWVTGTEGSNPSLSASQSPNQRIHLRHARFARAYAGISESRATGECELGGRMRADSRFLSRARCRGATARRPAVPGHQIIGGAVAGLQTELIQRSAEAQAERAVLLVPLIGQPRAACQPL